jgi:hypothetical protein
MTSKVFGRRTRIVVLGCAALLLAAMPAFGQCPAGSTCFGEVDTNTQSPSVSFSGDIPGARWLTHLGDFELTFSSDSSDTHSLGTGDTTFLGNTYHPKVAFTPGGDVLASGGLTASGNVTGSMLILNNQVPIALLGDIDGAKWLQHLGDFELTFSSDSANTTSLGTGDLALNGRTYRPKVAIDPTGTVIVSGGVVYPDGSLQNSSPRHARAGGCSLNGGSSLACNINLTWSGPFADTNYTAVCTPENAGGGTLSITGKSAGGITVTFTTFTVCIPTSTGGACGGPPSAGIGAVDCIAIHD